MKIQLQQAGKRYNRDWIFRNLTYTFKQGEAYAITGPNGSGKSTLLQVIASSTNASVGEIKYSSNDSQKLADDRSKESEITTENIYEHITIVAPYLEVIEEMTVTEFLQFHASFKPLQLSIPEIIGIVGLEKAAQKQIRYYSSGMKQRVKLAQAVFSIAPILLLDEPCTNLDKVGYELYHQLILQYCTNKLIIVSSNDENEMSFCSNKVNIMNYK
jgi:ABC-type multidrug transport system ATPase subunit